MFSDAMSSISSRWRPSSSSIARAISGSASARLAEKKVFDRWLAACDALMGALSFPGIAAPSGAPLAPAPTCCGDPVPESRPALSCALERRHPVAVRARSCRHGPASAIDLLLDGLHL